MRSLAQKTAIKFSFFLALMELALAAHFVYIVDLNARRTRPLFQFWTHLKVKIRFMPPNQNFLTISHTAFTMVRQKKFLRQTVH